VEHEPGSNVPLPEGPRPSDPQNPGGNETQPGPGPDRPSNGGSGNRRQCAGPGGEGDEQCSEDSPICVADPAAPRGAAVPGICVNAAAQCGGTRLLSCREGQICVDDPRDSCDPNAVGTDGCLGICI